MRYLLICKKYLSIDFQFQERVAAALENSHLLDVVNQCLAEEEE